VHTPNIPERGLLPTFGGLVGDSKARIVEKRGNLLAIGPILETACMFLTDRPIVSILE
jgi:hypothetical protein